MKSGLITAIVFLSLTAHSPAYGEEPESDGVQCVNDCIVSDDADTSVARSAFQRNIKRSLTSVDSHCKNAQKVLTCVEECQVDWYAILAREASRTVEKYCGDNVNEATTKKFFDENEQFSNAWLFEQEKCEKAGTTPEERCRLASDCTFGSALTSVKICFSDDVVSVNVNVLKITLGVSLESSGETLPSSCDVIFEPYEPEPPYEPYQPEPYQRNPYQRNPYQRNPYQHNPYQRNPYQRNPYQRNPVQCTNDCLWPDTGNTTATRSAFRKVAKRSLSSEDRRCIDLEETMVCVVGCRVERYVTLARALNRILEKYCGDNVDKATRKKYFADAEQFNNIWLSEYGKCGKNESELDTAEKACTDLTGCLFGSALTSAKKGIPADVISVTVMLNKMSLAAQVETSYGENPPSSCNLLFEPSVPEPEPYPYEPYQRNPYQRQPYQRNPYQRNPYQRNPYKHRN